MRCYLTLLLPLLACSGSNNMADAGSISTQTSWDLNDVSILMPLPSSTAERASALWLLPPSGSRGPGFPSAFVDQLPQLNADVPSVAGYPSVLIVGLRFDPCFQVERGCQAQIRLVGQPIQFSGESPSMLEDSAVHLFYALSETEASATKEALRAIRSASPTPTSGRLRVHPGLAQQGWSGNLAQQLRTLVTRHCRTDNFIRVTVNSFAMDNWSFHRFDVVNGALVPQTLAHLSTPDTAQAWLRQADRDSTEDPSGTIAPAPAADDFSLFLSATSFVGGQPVDASAAAVAAKALLRIENPQTHTPESADCVSCHVAGPARRFAQRNGVSFVLAERYVAPEGIDTAVDLDPRADGNLGVTIQFGYHSNAEPQRAIMPVISERTVFETAEVVARLRTAPP